MTASDTSAKSAGLLVGKCCACNTLYFPKRLICHRCGGGAWTDERIFEGTIEEATRIAAADESRDRVLATINAAGLRVIVALAEPLLDGAQVILEERNGAPWARAKET
jgi:uncharacterized OB-fold protein